MANITLNIGERGAQVIILHTGYEKYFDTFHESIVLKDLLCRPLQIVCAVELLQVIN